MTIAAALLWGSSWVATKLALDSFSAFAVSAWRGIGAAAALAIVLRSGSLGAGATIPRPSRGQLGRLAVLGLAGGAIFGVGMSLAVDLSGATMAAFVAGLYPVLAAAGAGLVLGERPGRIVHLGLLGAFAGVLLLAGYDPTGLPLGGAVVGLVAAVAFAAYLLLARRWSVPWRLPAPVVALALYATLAIAAVPLAAAGGAGGLAGSAAGGHEGPAALTAVAALVWLALPAGALAQSLAIAGVRRLPAHASSPYLLLNPLAAAILAALLLGERLAPLQLAGAALVLAGIGAATLPSRGRLTIEPVEPFAPGKRILQRDAGSASLQGDTRQCPGD